MLKFLLHTLPVKVASGLDGGAHGEFSSPVTELIIKWNHK
jgi:hypothetical protein